MKALIINYKTPTFTEAAVRSIRKWSPNIEVVVYDNSGDYDGSADCIIDNDIDFTEFLRQYPNKILTENDWGSVKHCYTIDRCFDLFPEGFILLDSDIIVTQDITPLWKPDKVWVGEIIKTRFNYIPRVAPFCCYINVPMCREYGIRYFNDQWMWRLHTNPTEPDADWYDTGAFFTRETASLPHLEVEISNYIVHYKGGSYAQGEMPVSRWIAENSDMYDKMDFVLPFVTCEDAHWKRDFARYNEFFDITRYRDFGTLRYLFRGVDKYMPFIDRIVLIVAYPSQVPRWVNRETVRVITHKEIMPASILPTFNSSVIECHINNIPDLSERFIYANDDMFPVGPLAIEDFFHEDGKMVINYEQRESATNPFLEMCEYVNGLAAGLAGLNVNHGYLRPDHFFSPMLKSVNRSIIKRLGETIPNSFTRLRHPDNINQYIYQDYYIYANLSVTDRNTYRAKRVSWNSPYLTDEIVRDLDSREYDIYCINDEFWWQPVEPELDKIKAAFQRLFPTKCRFEK